MASRLPDCKAGREQTSRPEIRSSGLLSFCEAVFDLLVLLCLAAVRFVAF